MRDLLSRIASLPPKKRELLLKQFKESKGDTRVSQTITRRSNASGLYPLSFGQQRLWFFDQLEPGGYRYNVPEAIRIKGPLNIAAMWESVNELVRRHEVLRTTFKVVNGEPAQVVAPSLILQMPVVDLREIPQAQREAVAWAMAIDEGQMPFDLARGPLLRPSLLQLSDQEFVFLLTNHHIISDRWSRNLLLFELMDHYGAFSKGEPSASPEPTLQYPDYSIWQREHLQGEHLEKLLAYWKKQLGGPLSVLELPTDHARPPVRTFRGGMRLNLLSRQMGDAVKKLYQSEGATLYMVMLSAWSTLLYRYSGQQDIIIGMPIANRNRPEIEKLIGFFVNTLAIRIDLSGDSTFRGLLKRVKAVTLDAYAHQDLPFEKLVEELHPERNLSYNPLFQISLNLQNQPLPTIKVNDLDMNLVEPDWGLAVFDLTLYVWESLEWESPDGGLTTVLVYNSDLFDPPTIERMIMHFQTLVESILANPDQRICDLEILTEAEKKQLSGWNNTGSNYPQDKCFHQLFEAQSRRTPGARAVTFGGDTLTYGELDRRANQLGNYLRRFGVGPEVCVGLMLMRGVEMVVALLGIMKAGGAYLPLDPVYPPERLAFMIKDAQAPVIITQRQFAEKFPDPKIDAICIDSTADLIAQESETAPRSNATADNAAYVIYTSGSTGKPKGVTIEHRSIANLSTALHKAIYSRYEPDHLRVGLNGPLTFDTSVKQLIVLLHGHTLHIVPQEVRLDGAALLSFLSQNDLDIVDCTPTQLGMMIDAGLLNDPRTTHLFIGGEPIDRATWDKLAKDQGGAFYNLYGPTECAVDALVCKVEHHYAAPVIGHPLANIQAHILDSHLRPVAVGVPGELHIGGAGIARGYLKRPDLTAEKFIPNPFSNRPGARLYKTGDIARYLPGGSIEFLRRIDHQVKIRGFRVELGEIEAVICDYDGVREAVAVIREESSRDVRIVAYVVAGDESFQISGLRSHLKKELPDYMIPSSFVLLEALPVTASGKIDRLALPAPDNARRDQEDSFVAPRNAIEEVLANIWASLLDIEKVGVRNNFFDLGGHSLMATRVLSRIYDAFQVEMSLLNLFEKPTIEELALVIEEALIMAVAEKT